MSQNNIRLLIPYTKKYNLRPSFLKGFTRISETGTFYPNTTINVRNYLGIKGSILA